MLRPGYGCVEEGARLDGPVLRDELWCCHGGSVMACDGLGTDTNWNI